MNRKLEQGLATRARLLDAATNLFAEHGYAGTSVDMVLAAADLSRGAFYHHFASKEAVFEAAVEATESRIIGALAEQAAVADSAKHSLVLGCQAYLRMARDPVVARLCLIDAPNVLGWDRWRELDARYGFGLMKMGVEAAAHDARLPAELVDSLAHVLLAALMELALLVARADKPRVALRRSEETMATLIEALFPSGE
ncbi:MAG: TetR/AcrR family transcriptional regulator [Actinobacteria bacterium]|nr:TetR/AcrR family transcriptional regulator [Actinomycetota bacterium]